MKILIIIATGNVGGPGKGLIQFLKNATPDSFDYVLCNFKAVWLDQENENSFDHAASASGLDLKILKQYIPFDPTIIFRAFRIYQKFKPDIVQTHGIKPNAIGYVFKQFLKAPWIGFAHGYTLDDIKIKTYNVIDSYFLRRADMVVAVSKGMKALLIDRGVLPEKIEVIHNAIDVEEIRPGTSEKEIRDVQGLNEAEPVVGVVGRLGPEKGQMYFLQAFRIVIERYPGIQALIVGEGQDAEVLENYCRKNNIEGNVHFVGHVRNTSDYYQVMDML